MYRILIQLFSKQYQKRTCFLPNIYRFNNITVLKQRLFCVLFCFTNFIRRWYIFCVASLLFFYNMDFFWKIPLPKGKSVTSGNLLKLCLQKNEETLWKLVWRIFDFWTTMRLRTKHTLRLSIWRRELPPNPTTKCSWVCDLSVYNGYPYIEEYEKCFLWLRSKKCIQTREWILSRKGASKDL